MPSIIFLLLIFFTFSTEAVSEELTTDNYVQPMQETETYTQTIDDAYTQTADDDTQMTDDPYAQGTDSYIQAGAAEDQYAQNNAAVEEDHEEDVATQHLTTAPKVDLKTLRDPFISYFDKARQEQLEKIRTRERMAKAASTELDPEVSNHINAQLIRPHDPLEEFDLSTLKLVAIMEVGRERIAMIENSKKIGFTVRVGEYMGTHNGRITHITDDSIIILETVLSPAEELVVEETTLVLHSDANE
ncbi:MAG: pilus assembly protein PilP [Mariprofundaceae bacterium]|nr:pilus assembly protein PilP [Mariprofundaceae bacterium]